jgi:hypothetical protein
MKKISEQISSKFKKFKLNKVIDLSDAKSAKESVLKMNAGLAKIKNNEEIDPSHKIYIQTQNILSYFAEEFSVLDEFVEYYDTVEILDREFMPSYPPMSPIIGSYFTYCCFCDFRFGNRKETICTIFKDLALEFKYDELSTKATDNLSRSSMKFYKHLGVKDGLVELIDILTGEKFICVCTAKYFGNPDEIWFARLVPNLDTHYDYQIILNTPYVVLKQNENDWLEYFKRQGLNKNESGIEDKMLNLMKNNPNPRYWHDYIMDAYLDYLPNCIYLTGMPDIKGSKPHEMHQ